VVNGKLHYPLPVDVDKPLHDVATEKIREHHADYNNRPSNVISFMTAVTTTSDRLHCELVRILFLQTHEGNRRPPVVSLPWWLDGKAQS